MLFDSYALCVFQVCSDDNSFSLHAAEAVADPSTEKAMLDLDCHDDTPGQVAGTPGSRKDYITIIGKRDLTACISQFSL